MSDEDKKDETKKRTEKKQHISSGMWLPEAGYSEDVARSVLWAFNRIIRDDAYLKSQNIDAHLFFILDERQFIKPSRVFPQSHWSCNYVQIGDDKICVFGRDLRLSDAFAFSSCSIENIALTVAKHRVDAVKDKNKIPYIITLASDLEALLSNAAQLKKFKQMMKLFREKDAEPMALASFLENKLNHRYKRWAGECEQEEFRAQLKDCSTWSDYLETNFDGTTSDTRWSGMKRIDGKIISRGYRNRSISQIWKQGYLCMTKRLNTEIRHAVLHILSENTDCTHEEAFDFLVAYNAVIFKEHYREQGYAKSRLDFIGLTKKMFKHCKNIEQVALAARAYYEMLMANRSCPLFWENIDTRVMFQNIVLYAHALIDLINLYEKQESEASGNDKKSEELFRLYCCELIRFDTGMKRYELDQLSGFVGWETSDNGWSAAVQSEIPTVSAYNVVRRAALYVGIRELPEKYKKRLRYTERNVLASTGHISGEIHGNWENKDFCENKES